MSGWSLQGQGDVINPLMKLDSYAFMTFKAVECKCEGYHKKEATGANGQR